MQFITAGNLSYITSPQSPYEPMGYNAWPADEKLAFHLARDEDTRYEKPPAGSLATTVGNLCRSLLVLNRIFDVDSDFRPLGLRRSIHPIGVTAGGEFVPEPNTPYTGVLKTGALVYLRLSTAVPGQMIPGISVKYLIDGKNSVDTVSIHELGPQKGRDFFLNELLTTIPDAKGAVKLGAFLFSLAKKNPTSLSPSNLCQVDRFGHVENSPRIPFNIVYEPTAAVKGLIPPDSKNAFQTDVMNKVPAGTAMYDVYAIAKKGGVKVKIGTIRTSSPFLATEHGDHEIFVRHNRNGETGLLPPSVWRKANDFHDWIDKVSA